MKNKLEHILLSILLGLSVLLGLSFWVNTIYNFNIFSNAHWAEFARLQAAQTPISTGFYVSFAVAIFIFLIGLYFIYRTTLRRITKPNAIPISEQKTQIVEQQPHIVEQSHVEKPVVFDNRPPQLNLPTNMAQIAAQKYNQPKTAPRMDTPTKNPYNSIISEIFSNAGYVVKPNPSLSGFTPNLFAIGNNEVVWVGGIDCDMEKMMMGLQKLDSVFKETLEDIPINISAFMLDTLNKYPDNNNMMIFKSVDELKEFIAEHPADPITETEKESFDSYSEYIDTIIQYIKNI